MLSFDFAVLNFIYDNCRNGFLDMLMPIISKLGNAGIVWIILTIALLISSKYRTAGFALLFALILDVTVCNIILKPLVARIRPCDVNKAIELLIACPNDYSFPSGHTASSFAAVSSLYFSQNWLFKPALVLAILISFSRLYLYVHYPTDIFAGIILGIIVGYLGYKLVVFGKSPWNKRKPRHLK